MKSSLTTVVETSNYNMVTIKKKETNLIWTFEDDGTFEKSAENHWV